MEHIAIYDFITTTHNSVRYPHGLFVLDHDGTYKTKVYQNYAITYGSLYDGSTNVVYLWDTKTGHRYAKIDTEHALFDVMYWNTTLYYSTGEKIYMIEIPEEGIGHITYDVAIFKEFTHDRTNHDNMLLHGGHIITRHWDGYLSLIYVNSWNEARYYNLNEFEFPNAEYMNTFKPQIYPFNTNMIAIGALVEKFVEQHGEVRTNDVKLYHYHLVIMYAEGKIAFEYTFDAAYGYYSIIDIDTSPYKITISIMGKDDIVYGDDKSRIFNVEWDIEDVII
jgi:hypothetical protein